MRFIDTEAHYYTAEFVDYLRSRDVPPMQAESEDGSRRTWYEPSAPDLWFKIRDTLVDGIADLGEGRIAAMDEAGVDVAILSLSGPGIDNLEPDNQLKWARSVNDALGAAVKRHPGRLYGMAALAPSKPEESAEELERCVREHDFRGVNLLSHSHGGEYYDHPRFRPIFEAAARLGTPINLHPTAPHMQMLKPYLGYGWALPGPGQGFGNETSVHVMRLIYSGLFDEYPDLKMTLGHFGEALTFWFYRIDFDFTKPWLDPSHRPKIDQRPSWYLKNNFWLNCSGNFLSSALLSTLMEVGADRIMWGSDYAWAPYREAVDFIKNAPLSDADREKIYWRNAAQIFRIDGTEAPQQQGA